MINRLLKRILPSESDPPIIVVDKKIFMVPLLFKRKNFRINSDGCLR